MNEKLIDKLYESIIKERQRQIDIHGDQDHKSNLEWLSILMEEVGEVSKDIIENDMTGMKKEILEVATVCIAWLESIDRKAPDSSADVDVERYI